MQTAQVLLFKEKNPRVRHVSAGRSSYSYYTQTILALQLPGESVIAFHPGITTKLLDQCIDEGEKYPNVEIVSMKESRASRLGKFCADYLAREADRVYTCKSFVNFVCEFTDVLEAPNVVRQYNMGTRAITAVDPGEPYATFRGGHFIDHTMLGTSRPDYCFGVMGEGGPLEVTSLYELSRVYNADYIRHINTTAYLGVR